MRPQHQLPGQPQPESGVRQGARRGECTCGPHLLGGVWPSPLQRAVLEQPQGQKWGSGDLSVTVGMALVPYTGHPDPGSACPRRSFQAGRGPGTHNGHPQRTRGHVHSGCSARGLCSYHKTAGPEEGWGRRRCVSPMDTCREELHGVRSVQTDRAETHQCCLGATEGEAEQEGGTGHAPNAMVHMWASGGNLTEIVAKIY